MAKYQDESINIPVEFETSESGEYYQQKHPALQLDIIQSLIPQTFRWRIIWKIP
jgi:hypothetical protein